jgi:hypothetical protein
MALTITFDPSALTVVVADSPNDVEVPAQLLYSAWKEWLLLSDNAKYPPAFRTIGGDPLGGGVTAGDYYFLANDAGWRLKLAEYDHRLDVTGNLYPEDAALALYTSTTGGYDVSFTRSLSSLTQTAGGLSASAIADEIFDRIVDNGLTFLEGQKLQLAAAAGDIADLGSGARRVLAAGGAQTRVEATVGAAERAVTLLDVS